MPVSVCRLAAIALVVVGAGCARGPDTTPAAGLAPAGVDPGASGGFSDPGSIGEGPYGDPGEDDGGFGIGPF